jgi:hypothetical protein
MSRNPVDFQCIKSLKASRADDSAGHERIRNGVETTARGRLPLRAERFRVNAAPLVTMACHYTGCQKMSSSAYSLSAALAESFQITQGERLVGGDRTALPGTCSVATA